LARGRAGSKNIFKKIKIKIRGGERGNLPPGARAEEKIKNPK
jgi:hypothetical protein